MTKNEIIDRILKIAEDVTYYATSLQPYQFNPESYEVSAEYIDDLTNALNELTFLEEIPDDYVI